MDVDENVSALPLFRWKIMTPLTSLLDSIDKCP